MPSPNNKSVFSKSNTSAPAFLAVIAAAHAVHLKLYTEKNPLIKSKIIKILSTNNQWIF
ncbi:hypothetical protein [Clostridium baratii]|uniref:hypothetical protein n=1 Tax=Clostridium baratii TaxID=1561 RepID=UPI002431F441|nr:hypothetical protein [Clostridium baratii]